MGDANQYSASSQTNVSSSEPRLPLTPGWDSFFPHCISWRYLSPTLLRAIKCLPVIYGTPFQSIIVQNLRDTCCRWGMVTCGNLVGSNLQPLGLLLNMSAFLWDPDIGSAVCLPHIDLVGVGGRSPVNDTPNLSWFANPHRLACYPIQTAWDARALS